MTQSRVRKVALAVRQWGSEESVFTWQYLRGHVLQPKDSVLWRDELTVLHVAKSKEKGDRWDVATPLVADVQTAIAPYHAKVVELEGEPGPAVAEYANKEGMDLLVVASRGRSAVQKAMMGSVTEALLLRCACACLVVKPQVGAGDTFRMKSAAQPMAMPQLAQSLSLGSTGLARSPTNNAGPAGGRVSSLPPSISTPFNRRVAIAYDTSANGRYLLKWAADKVLEPADNVFVVRAVPRVRPTGSSFLDKNSAQKLAGEVLGNMVHVTTYDLTGNARKAVLGFVGSESVDLLIIGAYQLRMPPASSGAGGRPRKGLALKGNALALYKRCACPCLVLPLTEVRLAAAVRAADLAAAVREQEEIDSGSESDSDDEAGASTTAPLEASAPAAALDGAASATKAVFGRMGLGMGSLKDALFKRRPGGSPQADGVASPNAADGPGLGAARARLALALAAPPAGAAGSGSPLAPGRYVVEVDGAGSIRSVMLADAEPGPALPGAEVAAALSAGAREAPVTAPAPAPAAPAHAHVTAADAADAAPTVPVSVPAAVPDSAASLRQLLAAKQAELSALQASLAQLEAAAV